MYCCLYVFMAKMGLVCTNAYQVFDKMNMKIIDKMVNKIKWIMKKDDIMDKHIRLLWKQMFEWMNN
jgi:hypothetical protein